MKTSEAKNPIWVLYLGVVLILTGLITLIVGLYEAVSWGSLSGAIEMVSGVLLCVVWMDIEANPIKLRKVNQ